MKVMFFPNVELLNSDGNSVGFYRQTGTGDMAYYVNETIRPFSGKPGRMYFQKDINQNNWTVRELTNEEKKEKAALGK